MTSKVQIYLFFPGTCLEAMQHYAKVLGGRIEDVMHNRDAPSLEDRMPGPDDLIMNLSLRLGDATIMASDAPAPMYQQPQGFSVTLTPDSRAEFERLFSELGKGAMAVPMPPGETFWAERFAVFVDRYGTPWMLNYEGAKLK